MWDVVFRFVVGMLGGAAVTALVMMIRRKPSSGAPARAGRVSRKDPRPDPAGGSGDAEPTPWSGAPTSGDRLERR